MTPVIPTLASLLPACVACEECHSHQPALDLWPQEEAVVARAVDKRRREFATVRRCARGALARLGRAPVAILPGKRGAPGWPEGIVGSMTHCAGYGAAALASRDRVITIGVDAEPNEPLPDGVLSSVACQKEQDQIAALLDSHPQVRWDRLLFSAKESVYKSWFPLTGQWLGFEEARIEMDPDRGTFTAELLAAGPVVAGTVLAGFRGRWAVTDRLVLTAICVLRQTETENMHTEGVGSVP